METIFFRTGSIAINYAIENLNLRDKDLIFLPDYYCEEINLFLSNKYRLNIYEISNNLKPKTDIVEDAIKKKAKLMILVQYFNTQLDLNYIIENCKSKKIKVLVDAIHIFPSKGKRLYKNADAEVYSVRKSLYLNSGSFAYVNNKLLKNKIEIGVLNLKNNLVSFIKIVRAMWIILYLPIFNGIYRKNSLFKKNKHENPVITADITSIVFCWLIRNFNIIYLINKYTKKRVKGILNIDSDYYLTFGYIFDTKMNLNKNNIYKWPTPIDRIRIKTWTSNSEQLYNNNNIISRYFYRE